MLSKLNALVYSTGKQGVGEFNTRRARARSFVLLYLFFPCDVFLLSPPYKKLIVVPHKNLRDANFHFVT